MSWCGGGEMRPTPGVECRVLAMYGLTFGPGSWPPSPGLAPRAILLWMSSALPRHPRGPRQPPGARGRLGRDGVGVPGVLAGDAEAAGRHLLDRAAALRVVQPLGVLPAL